MKPLKVLDKAIQARAAIMKYLKTIILLSAISLMPARAQAPAAAVDGQTGATSAELDPAALKKKARAEEQARDDKIKELEKAIARDSANKDNRLALADYLEQLAAESEKKDDWAGAWRFYQRTAAVLRDPPVDDWEKRAADDLAKAATYRQKQTDKRVAEEEAKMVARRAHDMPPIVAPSLDWKAKKEADIFAENRYREEVWKRVQSAWVNSPARKNVKDMSNFHRPVIISFDVHSDGEVSDIKITASSGDRRIDLAALQVVEDLVKIEPLLPGMGPLVRFHTEFGK